MELLQKFTLYDLLGYALPGTVVCYMIFDLDGAKEMTAMQIAAFLAAGYLTGILISEIAHNVTEKLIPCLYKKDIYAKTELPLDTVNTILHRAGVLKETESLHEKKEIGNYIGYMYGEIQIMPQYGRIHNYASAEVMYKNLAAVFVICGLFGLIRCRYGQTFVFLAGGIVFYKRYVRFWEKKILYTVNWFLREHNR